MKYYYLLVIIKFSTFSSNYSIYQTQSRKTLNHMQNLISNLPPAVNGTFNILINGQASLSTKISAALSPTTIQIYSPVSTLTIMGNVAYQMGISISSFTSSLYTLQTGISVIQANLTLIDTSTFIYSLFRLKYANFYYN